MATAKAQRDEKKRMEAGGGTEEEQEDDEEEEEDIDVPGSCYVKLLQCIQADKYSGIFSYNEHSSYSWQWCQSVVT